ncbi:MAG: hypothetical protein WBA44_17520 [Mesorhizobium sp.]
MTDELQGAEPVDPKKQIEQYASHLEFIAKVFNQHAEQLGLGVRLNTSKVTKAVREGVNYGKAKRFAEREDDSGVLHDEQLMTALDCVGELLTSPNKNGLVLGAMQSGKTTTSIALQFAGPIVYQLTGRRLYPLYLITSHTSQEDQTKIEISKFLDFYGDLAVEVDGEHRCTIIQYIKQNLDPSFSFSPTIQTYRDHVAERAFPDTMVGPRLEDFIQRRVKGDSIKKVANICRRVSAKGFTPMLIVDEPQYGASDRMVKVDDQFERRSCVLLQIFDSIDEALGDDAGERVFIGLSATPYELHDIQGVWKVNQYLSSAYSGFNFFASNAIDSGADVTPPEVMSFGELGGRIDVPFLTQLSIQAYDAQPQAFDRFAKKVGYHGNQDEYRAEFEASLRKVLLYMATNGTTKAPGICIRLFNNNNRSSTLIERLHLPPDQIEIIKYYGSDHKGQSVKRSLRQRQNPELPFLILVTNRARMGDAFPREVEWFVEFSKKAANLNALLQGLLGRACGYGKKSKVIMSSENADLVADFSRGRGAYFYKTSAHSRVVGPFRRGAPTNLIRVRRDMPDAVVQKFFARIDREVVEPNFNQNTAKMSPKRTSDGFRTGPILRIAEELGLFAHLEQESVRGKLFPTYPDFRIARADDEVISARQPDRALRYSLDANGDCRFTFREWETGANHGGVRSRGYGANDARDKTQAGDTLEPQVNMRKFDPRTGKTIDDKRTDDGHMTLKSDRQVGDWRAELVTLPLVAAVRELQTSDMTYPVPLSPYADWLNSEERVHGGQDYVDAE